MCIRSQQQQQPPKPKPQKPTKKLRFWVPRVVVVAAHCTPMYVLCFICGYETKSPYFKASVIGLTHFAALSNVLFL